MAELPPWPRNTTSVRVDPEHVRKHVAGSLTGSSAARAIADAIGPGAVTVGVGSITAHEKAAPFRHWAAETPEEAGEWLNLLDGGGCADDVENAARAGLLDFELTWTEGLPETKEAHHRGAWRTA
jgi:hypothetical protein